jgi:hypothetical protein
MNSKRKDSDQPLNHQQRQCLAWYLLGYGECLDNIEKGHSADALRRELEQFAQWAKGAPDKDSLN